MNALQFFGLWLTIVGAAVVAGIIAHDGSPIHDVFGLALGLIISFVGLAVGYTGSPTDNKKTEPK